MSSSRWSQARGDGSLSTQELSTADSGPALLLPQEKVLALTILHHPLAARLGHRALGGGGEVPLAVSRNEPSFSGHGESGGYPLECAWISRKPIWIQHEGTSVLIRSGGGKRPVRVDGVVLKGTIRVPTAQLEAGGGVLLEFGGCVLLWLHFTRSSDTAESWHGLVGISAKILALRQRIARLSKLFVPVLIRGESGVGKDLVAQALHNLSPRASGPWIALNMSAIPVSTAASELFGHGRGAFTGAERDRSGWLEQASGGTLFLDEIGEMPKELQPQLLRVLDKGVIQPIGRGLQQVDVRLIAATDADLEELVQSGNFRRALLFRLQGAEIIVPPLRDRREDIPLLLHHFLQEFLRELGAEDILNTPTPDVRPWLGTELLVELMRCPFPGNIRQLRNTALAIVAASHDKPHATVPQQMLRQLQIDAPAPQPPPVANDGLTDGIIRAALRRNGWVISRTASELQVARNTLIAAIDRSTSLRLARDLSAQEIRSALQAAENDIVKAAQALEISTHGLRLRMRELNMS